MSSATSRIVIPVLESLEQNEKPLVKTILKGVKNIQKQQIPSQSNTITQTSFSFQPPSQNSIIDRRFILEMDVGLRRATVGHVFATQNAATAPTALDGTGVAPNITQNIFFQDSSQAVGGVALTNGFETSQHIYAGREIRKANSLSLRQFPLTSAMASIDLVINGTHFSVSPDAYIHAVMAYTSPEWREKNFPSTAHCPDKHRNTGSVAGTSKDSMSTGFIGSDTGETPNGQVLQGAVNAALTTVGGGGNGLDSNRLTFKLREPLLISPLMAAAGHGLTNINNIDITIRWNANLTASMFRVTDLLSLPGLAMNGVGVTGTNNRFIAGNQAGSDATARLGAVDFNNAADAAAPAVLHIDYYEAQDDIKIPNEIVLPYKQPQVNVQNFTFANNQNLQVINGNNIRLNQIPDCCYIFVKQSVGNGLPDTPTNYEYIENVSLQWKNRTSILNSYQKVDLYDLAKQNGWNFNEADTQNVGLVLKLEYGKDIPLDDNESPGTRGDYNWQVNVSVRGRANTLAAQLVQVFVMNGHAIVSPNECRVMTGVLDLKDNVSAEEMGHSYAEGRPEVAGGSMVGGSEVGGSLIGGAAGHIKKAYSMGKKGVAMASAGAKMASCVGDAVKDYKSRA